MVHAHPCPYFIKQCFKEDVLGCVTAFLKKKETCWDVVPGAEIVDSIKISINVIFLELPIDSA